MSFLVWIDEARAAVCNDTQFGIYKLTPEEKVEYLAALDAGGRLKYTPIPGKRIAGSGAALNAYSASWGDQKRR